LIEDKPKRDDRPFLIGRHQAGDPNAELQARASSEPKKQRGRDKTTQFPIRKGGGEGKALCKRSLGKGKMLNRKLNQTQGHLTKIRGRDQVSSQRSGGRKKASVLKKKNPGKGEMSWS